jgi:hypothetical protein
MKGRDWGNDTGDTGKGVLTCVTFVTYVTDFPGIQYSFMPFRLPCPQGSAHIQPGFGDIDA